MDRFTTNEAAKFLGTTGTSLVRYMKKGKIPIPEIIKAGKSIVHSWTKADIERVRKLLPRIKNGRKTRYQKKQSVRRGGQLAKAKRKKRK